MNYRELSKPHFRRIVDYHIEMLSVGAADCFIIHYTDSDNNNYIILVDSGNYNDADNILQHLRDTYQYDNLTINLAIVTHPDDDHYGGFVKMLEKLKNKDNDAIPINKFWINNPQNHITTKQVENNITTNTLQKRVAKLFDQGDSNLLDLISELGIPTEEKFAKTKTVKSYFGNQTSISVCREREFLGFTIVGPTESYFEELAPQLRYDNLKGYKYDNVEDNSDFKPDSICLSRALDNANDDPSKHNQSSLIFVFEPETKVKYLFCGDAGEEAFCHIPGTHINEIRDVYWMKVPHHGSKHNLTSNIINYCNPKIAYISTEKRGHYLNQCTINALKEIGCDVYSNHKNHINILHHSGQRKGYEPINPE